MMKKFLCLIGLVLLVGCDISTKHKQKLEIVDPMKVSSGIASRFAILMKVNH